MNNEQIKDKQIEVEFNNDAYSIINEAITYTMKKYKYKEYDIVKLVMILYNENYSYISSDNGYRENFLLLAHYFKKKYGHNIITFEMIKKIIQITDEKKYNKIVTEIALIENAFRTDGKGKPNDLSIFSYPIENKKYDDLMHYIEKNISMKFAIAIMYDELMISEN